MSIELIQQRLLSYQCQNTIDQGNALKEIAQEIALMSLSRAGFFQSAVFQGGTCLRILYGLERFSEDLDFVLKEPNIHFNWSSYIASMQEEFQTYGYTVEVINKTKLDKAIRSAFLKTDSVGGLMVFKENNGKMPKLQIKLEIDTNPPAGSVYEINYLDFPLPYSIQSQNLPSLFASKCHALLCREYTKGRDWYDFSWYVSKATEVNFSLLTHAMIQSGPWKDSDMIVTPPWLIEQLILKINQLEWEEVKKDVIRFLRPQEQRALDVWSNDFFLSRVEKLSSKLLNGDH